MTTPDAGAGFDALFGPDGTSAPAPAPSHPDPLAGLAGGAAALYEPAEPVRRPKVPVVHVRRPDPETLRRTVEQMDEEARPAGVQPPGAQASGAQAPATHASGNQAWGNQASGNQAWGAQAWGNQASGTPASGAQWHAEPRARAAQGQPQPPAPRQRPQSRPAQHQRPTASGTQQANRRPQQRKRGNVAGCIVPIIVALIIILLNVYDRIKGWFE